ncbi:MAG: RraA family protein [Alphaproteobacteria bacterium]
MLDEHPTLTIRRAWSRPSADDIAAFAGILTGNVVDALGGRGAMHHTIKPLADATGATPAICGPALPCWTGPDDNLALAASLAFIQPGDVLVCATDSFTGSAVSGDLVLGMARNNGATGLVTDGAVRDLPGIHAVGLPVFCTAVTPNSPARSGPGTVGLEVVVGGVQVAPGDLIVGDGDGIVVVPQAILAETRARLAEVRKAEAATEKRVMQEGLKQPDYLGPLLDSPKVRYVD